MISLASGAAYFRSPDVATQAAITALQAGSTYYGSAEGTAALRQAICDQYLQYGISLKPKQVLVTPGTKQALFNLFSVLLHRHDEVVVPTPAWFGFHELMKYSSGKLVPLHTKSSENYHINPDNLYKTLNARSRILLLTNPGNPTGRVYSKAELEVILEVASQFPDLYVISDEIYDHITYGRAFTPILSCQGAKPEKTFLLNGFSKSFAMSGWRLGYMLGPESCIRQCVDFQRSTFSGVSDFLQNAAHATLKQQAHVLAPMLEVLQQHRQFMQEGLQAIPEIAFQLPEGAYYFFPDLRQYLHRHSPSGTYIAGTIDLCGYLREEFALELLPGEYFGAPGHVRMSFAVKRPTLQEALARLKQALEQLRK